MRIRYLQWPSIAWLLTACTPLLGLDDLDYRDAVATGAGAPGGGGGMGPGGAGGAGGAAGAGGGAGGLSVVWAKHFGDDKDQTVNAVAVDAAGAVALTGYFAGPVDFGGGNPLMPAGTHDAYLAKLTSEGALAWNHGFGSSDVSMGVTLPDQGYAVAFGPNLDLVTVGTFQDEIDLKGGMPINIGNGYNTYRAKYDALGQHLWSGAYGGDDGFNVLPALARTPDGGAIIAGGTSKNDLDLGGGSPAALGGFVDAVIVSIDAEGAHRWSKRLGGPENEQFDAVAVDAQGNVFGAGVFKGTAQFGGASLMASGNDLFVAKYDPNGKHLWSKGFGPGGDAMRARIAVDAKGDVFVAGSSRATMSFGGDPLVGSGNDDADVIVAKLRGDGAHLWSKRFGDLLDQGASGIAVDGSGNAVVCGTFYGTLDFGGAPALESTMDRDAFVVVLDGASGAHVASLAVGGAGEQHGSAVAATAGAVVLGVTFTGTADLSGKSYPSAGAHDILIARLSWTP
jgi:hypothetical protein